METNKYKKLNDILNHVIKATESAQKECMKQTPDDTKICQLAYENLEGLLSQIGSVIFSECFNMV